MVQLEDAGMIITIIMIAAGVLMTAIAADPTMDSSTLPKSMENLGDTQTTINELMEKINSDFETFTSSSGWGQIPLGANIMVTIMQLVLTYIVSAFTNWGVIFNLLFGWNATLAVMGGILQVIISFIMIYTIYKFIAGIVKSMPFFGSG